MKVHKYYFPILLLILVSCSHEPPPNHSLSLLSAHMRIEGSPKSVLWEIYNKGGSQSTRIGPSDQYLFAVLSYTNDNYNYLKVEYQEFETINDKVGLPYSDLKGWFTEDLKRTLIDEGDFYRFSNPVYDYDGGRNTFKDGYIVFLDNSNTVFIYLSTI